MNNSKIKVFFIKEEEKYNCADNLRMCLIWIERQTELLKEQLHISDAYFRSESDQGT